jgi:hypothetical protein
VGAGSREENALILKKRQTRLSDPIGSENASASKGLCGFVAPHYIR